MRYYKAQIEKNMTYKRALNKSKKLGVGISRPSEWDGVHFEIDGEHIIIKKDGSILKNPSEVYSVKAKDWAIVKPTKRAVKKLLEAGINVSNLV